ncbi:MAG: phosphate signaling complex protein PhoU [Planctomycetota bacterium]
MSIHLRRDLDAIRQDLQGLAGLVETAIYKSIRALTERDAALAKTVIDGDKAIDAEENHIDEECLKVLALHQPVAVDLRLIASAMMIVVDLERMGDIAEEIAERAVHLASRPPLAIPDDIIGMTDLSISMVKQSLEAFIGVDAEMARRIIRMDDGVNELNNRLIAHILNQMRNNPAQLEENLSLFSVIRCIERIADHATNIAEDVCYLVEGEIVRHTDRAQVLGRPRTRSLRSTS